MSSLCVGKNESTPFFINPFFVSIEKVALKKKADESSFSFENQSNQTKEFSIQNSTQIQSARKKPSKFLNEFNAKVKQDRQPSWLNSEYFSCKSPMSDLKKSEKARSLSNVGRNEEKSIKIDEEPTHRNSKRRLLLPSLNISKTRRAKTGIPSSSLEEILKPFGSKHSLGSESVRSHLNRNRSFRPIKISLIEEPVDTKTVLPSCRSPNSNSPGLLKKDQQSPKLKPGQQRQKPKAGEQRQSLKSKEQAEEEHLSLGRVFSESNQQKPAPKVNLSLETVQLEIKGIDGFKAKGIVRIVDLLRNLASNIKTLDQPSAMKSDLVTEAIMVTNHHPFLQKVFVQKDCQKLVQDLNYRMIDFKILEWSQKHCKNEGNPIPAVLNAVPLEQSQKRLKVLRNSQRTNKLKFIESTRKKGMLQEPLQLMSLCYLRSLKKQNESYFARMEESVVSLLSQLLEFNEKLEELCIKKKKKHLSSIGRDIEAIRERFVSNQFGFKLKLKEKEFHSASAREELERLDKDEETGRVEYWSPGTKDVSELVRDFESHFGLLDQLSLRDKSMNSASSDFVHSLNLRIA